MLERTAWTLDEDSNAWLILARCESRLHGAAAAQLTTIVGEECNVCIYSF